MTLDIREIAYVIIGDVGLVDLNAQTAQDFVARVDLMEARSNGCRSCVGSTSTVKVQRSVVFQQHILVRKKYAGTVALTLNSPPQISNPAAERGSPRHPSYSRSAAISSTFHRSPSWSSAIQFSLWSIAKTR